jgi:hypothetical protein
MKIQIEITIDDMVAFNLYHYENSRFLMRTTKFLHYFLYGVAFFILGDVLIDIYQGRNHNAFLRILYVVIFIGMLPLLQKFLYPLFIKGMFKEGKNRGTLGSHEIRIGEDAIVDETDSGTQIVKWQAVEKVAKTEKYIIIYISSVSAQIIPRRSFLNDNSYEEFYDLVLTKINSASQDK